MASVVRAGSPAQVLTAFPRGGDTGKLVMNHRLLPTTSDPADNVSLELLH